MQKQKDHLIVLFLHAIKIPKSRGIFVENVWGVFYFMVRHTITLLTFFAKKRLSGLTAIKEFLYFFRTKEGIEQRAASLLSEK